ncbi:MAG: TIM-barrel domain-containing protein [Phycisphaerales bacterium JB040]
MPDPKSRPERYRFPTTLRARMAHAAGLGDRTRALETSTGERVGDGIFRYRPTRADPAAMPPSLALARQPEVHGPANDARVVPAFARTWDGRHVATVRTGEGTDLYGTGEIAGPLRRNGKRTRAWNSDLPGYTEQHDALYQSHPWVLAVRPDGTAFGVLADTTWECAIDLSSEIEFRAKGGPFRVYVIERDSPEGVLRGLAELTGRIQMPARWTLGYHQCRFSYEPDERVREVAREFRQRRIPCDVIWMDIDYMDKFKIFTFDPVKFPDPSKLNDDLHDLNFKAVWMIDPGPGVENDYSVWEEGTERDLWCRTWDGDVFTGAVWPPECTFPDFTRPDTCEWWAGLYRDFMATGVDGVWNDMNEPALVLGGAEGNYTMPLDARHKGGLLGLPPGPHAQYHNVYGLLMVRASLEGIKRANPDKRPFLLTRANYIGGQRYAATWTGDNSATWNDLHWSITMGLNMGLSGQPFVGPDLGGFMKEGTPEMMAKWWGLGAMLPFCRGHVEKGRLHKEPWAFGPEVEATIRRALERRYRLLPYFYTLFREAHETGLPVMRPVFFADPKDPALRDEDHAFLLGSDLLVLVNDIEGDTPPRHRIPAGTWRAFEPVEGPVALTGDPAIPELRLRGGAIVPMGPAMQWHDEKPVDPLTLVVCLDADGRAVGELYEDDGEGHAHERGGFCRQRFTAVREGDAVVVRSEVVGGDRTPRDRAIEVELLTEHGVVRGAGRSAEAVRVSL